MKLTLRVGGWDTRPYDDRATLNNTGITSETENT